MVNEIGLFLLINLL